MKRIVITVFFLMVLTLFLCGCGENSFLPSDTADGTDTMGGTQTESLAGQTSKSVLVRCGDRSVDPFSGLVGSNGYDSQGNQIFCGEGAGLSDVIERVKENPSLCPSLIVDGAVSVDAPSHYSISSLRIYDLKYQKLDYSVGWDSLYTLPKGEYLIQFSATLDSRKIKTEDDGAYTMDYYGYLFRMIIE